MDFNLNSTMIIMCIFLVSLGVCYLVVRIMYSGPIKISEHGTMQYIFTIVAMVIAAIIITIIVSCNYNIGINFNDILKYLSK